MRAGIIALALVIIGSQPAAAWNWCDVVWQPPQEFKSEPIAKYDTVRFPPGMVRDICMMTDRPLSQVAGCASEELPGTWWIYIRNDLGAIETHCVLMHEKGHVNGWDHSQRDAMSTRHIPGPLYRMNGPPKYRPLP